MTDDEKGAFETVKHFLEGYSQRNVEACMSLISAAKPILLFGTNENEVFKTPDDVRSALKSDFEGMIHIHWGEHRHFHVEAQSTFASVLLELPISYQVEGKEHETLFRYALTLVKEDGQWKICSGMASVPFAAGTYSFSE